MYIEYISEMFLLMARLKVIVFILHDEIII